MRRTLRHIAVLAPLVFASGCHLTAPAPSAAIAADRAAMPPNTIMLSEMMRDLDAQPGFTERLLAQLNKGEKAGAYLTPELFDTFRKLILGKDWGGLDRFPGWTTKSITRSVHIAEHVLTNSSTSADGWKYLDLGTYALDKGGEEDFDRPSKLPPFKEDAVSLGADVVRGDGPDPRLAPMRPESQRLADVMNRLAMNGVSVAAFTARLGGKPATTPEELMEVLMQSGHQITVADVRYFANFGHFHYRGQDVEMPFWINSGWLVPAEHWWQRPRPLLVPVAHAEYEWIITGPKVNADVTFYFGIDGKAEFRTNDWLNQPWVMGRHAHEYRGAQAIEVTRLAGKFVRAYSMLHAKHPDLPFGGYYALGVCQDSIGAIEMKMTGKTTLFPNTARTEFFHDQPDEEITKLMEAVPKDDGRAPDAERVFGSLPTDDFARITIPGLRDDVQRSYAAWQRGALHRANWWRWRVCVAIGVLIASITVLTLWFRR
ncbi:MAG: hypothetical protein JSS87_05990 [Acidobacteria bacterium]|nr:hypothetical protein [Acidobacteriota bacterium]